MKRYTKEQLFEAWSQHTLVPIFEESIASNSGVKLGSAVEGEPDFFEQYNSFEKLFAVINSNDSTTSADACFAPITFTTRVWDKDGTNINIGLNKKGKPTNVITFAFRHKDNTDAYFLVAVYPATTDY